MSQGEMRHWKERIREMHTSPENDSLELRDSWKAIPRRTEVIGNKGQGLYRRSALPPLATKNIYNIIIEKPPQPTVDGKTISNLTNEAAAVPQIPTVSDIKPLTPEEMNSFNFSNFLSSKSNGDKCTTSTPFPTRSEKDPTPMRINVDIQLQAVPSQNNNLRLPSQIPISTTPRTSRVPSHPSDGRSVQNKRRNSENHPVVSSTVNANDDEECETQETSPTPQEEPQSEESQRVSHTTVNVNQKENPVKELFTEPQDEVLFRRPRRVLQPQQKQKLLNVLIDPEIEPPPDHEKASNQPNNSHRGRKSKPKPKGNDLLENYMKLGETLRNRTDSSQTQSSISSSTRRKLYKKGDSCNEDAIVDTTEPFKKIPCESNPLSSNDGVAKLNGAGDLLIPMQSETTENERNHDTFAKPTATNKSQRTTVFDQLRSADKADHNCNGIELEIQTKTQSSNNSNKLPNVSQHVGPNNQQENIEGYGSEDESVHQPTIRGGHNSHEDILEYLSDTSTSTVAFSKENIDDFADSSDDEPVRESNEKQAPKESRVLSKKLINKEDNLPPLKKDRSRHVQSNEKRLDVEDRSDDKQNEELLLNPKSKQVRSKKQKYVNSETNEIVQVISEGNEKKRLKSTKTKSVQSNKQSVDDDECSEDEEEMHSKNPINKEDNLPPLKKDRSRYVQSNKKRLDVDDEGRSEDEEDDELSYNSKSKEVRSKKQKGVSSDTNKIVQVISEGNEKKRSKSTKTKSAQSNKQSVDDDDERSEDEEEMHSKNPINKEDNLPPSKKGRSRYVQSNKKRLDVDDEGRSEDEEDDELSYNSKSKEVRSKKQKGVNSDTNEIVQVISEGNEKKRSKSTKTKSVQSNKQRVDDDDRSEDEEDDELSYNTKSKQARSKKQKGVNSGTNENMQVISEDKKKKSSKSTRTKPVQVRQQRENVDDDFTETNQIEPQIVKGNKNNPSTKTKKNPTRSVEQQHVEIEDYFSDSNENEPHIDQTKKPKTQPVRLRQKGGVVEEDFQTNDDGDQNKKSKKSKTKPVQQRMEIDDCVESQIESQLPTTSRGNPVRSRNQRVNIDTEEVVRPSTKTNSKQIEIQIDENKAKQPLKKLRNRPPRSKNQPVNNEEEVVVPASNESENEEMELPKKSKVKTQRKRLNNDDDNVMEANVVDQHPSERDEIQFNEQPGTSTNASKKNQNQQRQMRKQQLDTENKSETDVTNPPIDESDKESSEMSNDKISKKSKKSYRTKWEIPKKNLRYNPLKPREVVEGTRHSNRPIRLPENNLLLSFPRSPQKRKALKGIGNSVSKRIRSNESRDVETVYSMILNGTGESMLPLVTHLHGIEIVNGFHTTIKNKLAIHHIPGEAGPAYGYLTLQPGGVKQTCRNSFTLHIHVICGPVEITTDKDSETMITGSFAYIPMGTKYSLRNDGENTAVLFFNQQQQENSSDNSENGM